MHENNGRRNARPSKPAPLPADASGRAGAPLATSPTGSDGPILQHATTAYAERRGVRPAAAAAVVAHAGLFDGAMVDRPHAANAPGAPVASGGFGALADRLPGHRRPIRYAAVAGTALAALPALLARWLPSGRIEGHEYLALNPTRHDRHLGSFRINLRTGRWADFATGDKGGDPVSLAAYLFRLTRAEAARRLAGMLGVR
jgi:hypothetical protein